MENATFLLKLAASGDEQAEAKLFSLIGPEIIEIVRERIERGNDGELANSYTLAKSMFQQVMKHRNFPRESMRGFLNYLRWKSRMLLIDRARRSQRQRDFQASAGQQKVEKLAIWDLYLSMFEIVRDQRLPNDKRSKNSVRLVTGRLFAFPTPNPARPQHFGQPRSIAFTLDPSNE